MHVLGRDDLRHWVDVEATRGVWEPKNQSLPPKVCKVKNCRTLVIFRWKIAGSWILVIFRKNPRAAQPGSSFFRKQQSRWLLIRQRWKSRLYCCREPGRASPFLSWNPHVCGLLMVSVTFCNSCWFMWHFLFARTSMAYGLPFRGPTISTSTTSGRGCRTDISSIITTTTTMSTSICARVWRSEKAGDWKFPARKMRFAIWWW